MRTIFFGTPLTALPFLECLYSKEEVVAVVTRPDKPRGRGQLIQKSPIKVFAEEKKIPIFQPSQLNDPQFVTAIKNLNAEVGIVVAYGRIIPIHLIQLFPKGLYNVHFSLLPRWRGASPIQWAILSGDSATGVTTFKLSETLDTGEILLQKETPISPEEDSISLEKKLIPLGISCLTETLDLVKSGRNSGTPQGNSPSPYARLLKKEDAKISWESSAIEIHRKIRALIRMGPFCILANGKILKILRAQVVDSSVDSSAEFGTVIKIERGVGFVIICKEGSLLILEVQPEGKNKMNAWSFLQGHKIQEGIRLG